MSRTSTQNILVSTTPRLEGWEIREYLGAVSAHVVAGTNIFSDIAASWRDVFGGQSQSYKKQLEQINEQVVDELREEASARGGNALVGLRIDHDQISGQNKEMFMVTASATAVRAQSSSKQNSAGRQEGEKAVTAREVSTEEQIVRLNRKAQHGDLKLEENRWRFLIENQVADLAGFIQNTVIETLDGLVGRPTGNRKKQLGNARDYFLSIPEDNAKDHLYDMMSHDESRVVDWAVGVLEDGNLLDLGRIETMLKGDFYEEQKPALEILTRVDKPYYEKEDLGRLEALKSMIENGFGKKGKVIEVEVEESGMFSSDTKKKEVWQIKDSARNPMDQKYCSETGLDIYGFGKTETRPDEALGVLKTKIAALNRKFERN
ncbi:YbjQ family protein [Salinibacter ruber]|uniref:YbjQ family protein n=1 Tax=Salinibacter ruber TaxID=146919 RepID=UPI001F081DF2|nr:YbjQ family protein [Salinibacter ruber]